MSYQNRKGKAIPLQARTDPEVSSGSQFSRQSAHEDGKVVSRMHRPPLSPTKYSWYSFLLEAVLTQGHCAVGRMSMKNSNDTIGNRNHGLPACIAIACPTRRERLYGKKVLRYEIFTCFISKTFRILKKILLPKFPRVSLRKFWFY